MQIELNFTKKQLFLALGTSLMAGVFFLAVQVVLYFNFQYEKSLIENDNLISISEGLKNRKFSNLSLAATSYLVWDIREQKVISSLNEEMQLPLASLTKLMTTYIVSNSARYDSVLTIKDENLKKEGDSGLLLGEKWSLANLIDFVLISSSNDGANALASLVYSLESDLVQEDFTKKMNNTAKDLGMAQSFFLNETGLDINEKVSGAYGSVKDTVILLENILENNPTLMSASVEKNKLIDSDITTHKISNTNIIVDKLPGVLASKTGFTDSAGGNLIMAFDIGLGHNIIISVLGSTKEERFEDMEKLFWASLKKIN